MKTRDLLPLWGTVVGENEVWGAVSFVSPVNVQECAWSDVRRVSS